MRIIANSFPSNQVTCITILNNMKVNFRMQNMIMSRLSNKRQTIWNYELNSQHAEVTRRKLTISRYNIGMEEMSKT